MDLDGDLPLGKEAVSEWIWRAGAAVTNYLGRFPVNNLLITVRRGGGGGVNDGVTQGGSSISVRLGEGTSERDLRHDWVMTHEMFHLAFPTLQIRYSWMMEGLSDYLEPVARARVGQISQEELWREFVDNFPRGLPEAGDGGLDNSEDRDRIYWGGNLFWLLVDMQIREETRNARSLDDAILAILAAGGDGGARWAVERVLKVGDKATGTSVLKNLYKRQGPKAETVNLPELWKRLGVAKERGRIIFDDAAPLAEVRKAIGARRK